MAKDPTICSCEYRRWEYRIRWSSLWGHETLYWVGESHANCATGTFGGAPDGATKRCTGLGNRMRAAPLGPSVELLMGPRNAVLGVPKWGGAAMRTAPLGPQVELPMRPRNAVLGVRMAEAEDGRVGGGGSGRNAGRCLFKTRTQHHRMVWNNRSPSSRTQLCIIIKGSVA